MISTNFTTNNKHIKAKWLLVAIFAATLVVPLLILLFNPTFESSQSVCPVKALTGFPCPGCGITKSIIFFYKGEILTSLSYHLLGIPAVIFAALSLAIVLLFKETPSAIKKIIFNKQLGFAFALFLVVYHSIRLVLFVSAHNMDEILKESIWK